MIFLTLTGGLSLALITDDVEKCITRLMNYVRKGCLSDDKDIPLYHLIGHTEQKLPIYHCFRGTKSVESVHSQMILRLGAMNCGLELADCLLAEFKHEKSAWLSDH